VLRRRISGELHQRVQGQTESANDYIAAIRKLTRAVGVEGELERYVIQQGLRPELRKCVMLAQPTSMDEILTVVRLAASTETITDTSTTTLCDALIDKVIAAHSTSHQIVEEQPHELQEPVAQLWPLGGAVPPNFYWR